MKSLKWGLIVCAVAVTAGALTTACSSTFVVVPRPEAGYSATDTLRGYIDGEEVRVVFRFDSILRVDTVRLVETVLRVDTVRTAAIRSAVRVDTVLVVDTVRVPAIRSAVRVDTVVHTVVRTDTVRLTATETVVRVDTVRVPVTETVVRVDTVRVAVTDTVFSTQTVVRVDTVRVAVTDTVVRTETVRIPGQRVLFVPPGHYPPDGECRVWIHNRPPGQQARARACDALGSIPAGAFILFGGEAWDFDYDWLAASLNGSETAPPEILALKRRG